MNEFYTQETIWVNIVGFIITLVIMGYKLKKSGTGVTYSDNFMHNLEIGLQLFLVPLVVGAITPFIIILGVMFGSFVGLMYLIGKLFNINNKI